MKYVFRRYKWSFLSIGTSLGLFAISFGTILFLQRLGMWNSESALGINLGRIDALGMLGSIAIAVVAIIKERPPIWGLVALLLGLFSFCLYVR